MSQKKVIVCVKSRSSQQPSCGARGGETIAKELESIIMSEQLDIRIERFKCLGYCEEGPNLKLSPEGQFLHHVSLETLTDYIPTLKQFLKN